MTSQDEPKPENLEEAKPKKKKKRKFRGEVYIEKERCKGCGFCVEFCPTETLALSEDFNEKGYHPPKVVDIDRCWFWKR